jgi:hypothetical protein
VLLTVIFDIATNHLIDPSTSGANGLSHVVRAPEVPTNGFFFHFDKKCATIFSCSHYCGNNNDCAVLFVDREQIRVVRVDTSNNASATDC